MKIFDIDFWEEVTQAISRNKNRSFMTSLGVFWGVLLLIILVGFSIGLKSMMSEMMGGMQINTTFYMSSSTSIPYKGMQVGRQWRIDDAVLNGAREVKGVKHVIPFYRPISSTIMYNTNSVKGQIVGKDIDDTIIMPIKILKGRYLNKVDFDESRKVCVIGEQLEEELFHGEYPIGKKIVINNSLFTVIGVVVNSTKAVQFYDAERSASIPSTIYNKIYNNIHYSMIAVMAEDYTDPIKIEKEVANIIRSIKTISPDDRRAINSFNLKEMVDKLNMFILGIGALTWIVGIGTLFASIVGVSNIMLVVVRERTQEIGVRRALGAKPSMILTQIMTESFCITFIAGILGFVAGVGILAATDSLVMQAISFDSSVAPSSSIQISFWLGLGLTGIIIAGSLLAGLLPASRALKIKAVDALREE